MADADTTLSSDAAPIEAAPPPVQPWSTLKTDPQFKALPPDKQLIAFDRWHTLAYNQMQNDPNKDQFNTNAAKTEHELGAAARAATPDSHFLSPAMTPDEARYRLASDTLTKNPTAPLSPDVKAAYDKGMPEEMHRSALETDVHYGLNMGRTAWDTGKQMLYNTLSGIGRMIAEPYQTGDTGLPDFMGGKQVAGLVKATQDKLGLGGTRDQVAQFFNDSADYWKQRAAGATTSTDPQLESSTGAQVAKFATQVAIPITIAAIFRSPALGLTAAGGQAAGLAAFVTQHRLATYGEVYNETNDHQAAMNAANRATVGDVLFLGQAHVIAEGLGSVLAKQGVTGVQAWATKVALATGGNITVNQLSKAAEAAANAPPGERAQAFGKAFNDLSIPDAALNTAFGLMAANHRTEVGKVADRVGPAYARLREAAQSARLAGLPNLAETSEAAARDTATDAVREHAAQTPDIRPTPRVQTITDQELTDRTADARRALSQYGPTEPEAAHWNKILDAYAVEKERRAAAAPPPPPARATADEQAAGTERQRVDTNVSNLRDQILGLAKQQGSVTETPSAARAARVEEEISKMRQVAQTQPHEPEFYEAMARAHEQASKDADAAGGPSNRPNKYVDQGQAPGLYDRKPPRAAAEIGAATAEAQETVNDVPVQEGYKAVTVRREDGSTYQAAQGPKDWELGGHKIPMIARVVDGGWSHGMLGNTEQIVQPTPEVAAAQRSLEKVKAEVAKSADTVSVRNEEEFWGKNGVWSKLLEKVGPFFDPTKTDNLARAAKVAVKDVNKFLKDNPHYADYYDKDMKTTRSIIDLLTGKPLSEDEFKFFQMANGLTSPQTSLQINVADTLRVLKLFRDEGNLDKIKMGVSKKGNRVIRDSPFQISGATNSNKAFALKIVDRLIKEKGSVGAVSDFLQEAIPSKDLQAFNIEMGFKSKAQHIGSIREIVKNATGQSALIPRMFIFGRKVGAYTLNSLGDHRYNTTDVWEARFIRSYFPRLFEAATGQAANVDEHVLFSTFSDLFKQEFEKMTGKTSDNSSLQAARWFYILDAAKQAGYNAAFTNETISHYAEKFLRSGDKTSGGLGDQNTPTEAAIGQPAATEGGGRGPNGIQPPADATGVNAGTGRQPAPEEIAAATRDGWTPIVSKDTKTQAAEGRVRPLLENSFPSLLKGKNPFFRLVPARSKSGGHLWIYPTKAGEIADNAIYFDPVNFEKELELQKSGEGIGANDFLRQAVSEEIGHKLLGIDTETAQSRGREFIQANPSLARKFAERYFSGIETQPGSRERLISKMLDTPDGHTNFYYETIHTEAIALFEGKDRQEFFRAAPKTMIDHVLTYVRHIINHIRGTIELGSFTPEMRADVKKTLVVLRDVNTIFNERFKEASPAIEEILKAVIGSSQRPHPQQEPMVNIGLNTDDGKGITPAQATAALEQHEGVKVTKQSVHQSGTEPTMVADLSRSLTPDEAHKTSTDLGQQAIAHIDEHGKGDLHGPKAAEWRPFDTNKFLNHEGKPINTYPVGKTYRDTSEHTVTMLLQAFQPEFLRRPLSPETIKIAKLKEPAQFKGVPLPNSIQGEIPIVHYSAKALDTVETKHFGKGAATPTDLRGEEKGFFFVAGSNMVGDEKFFGKGDKNAYGAKIDGSQIYDLSKGKPDPLKWNSTISRYEADYNVRDAGYKGIMVETDDGRKVVMMFEPTKVESIGKPQPGAQVPEVGASKRGEQPDINEHAKLLGLPEEQPPAPAEQGGIAQKVADTRGAGVAPGEVQEPEVLIQQGRDRLAKGESAEARIQQLVAAKQPASSEDFGLFRARLEQLQKTSNDAGTISPEETAFWNSVKPFQTQWSEQGLVMQGRTDLDTGTLLGLQRGVAEATGRPMKPSENVSAQKIIKQTQDMRQQQATAEGELLKKIDEMAPKTTKVPTDKESLAQIIAQYYPKDGTISAVSRVSHVNNIPKPVKAAIWKYAKDNYMTGDTYVTLEQVEKSVGADLGMPPGHVREIIAELKGARKLSDDAYAAQAQQRMIVSAARTWMSSLDRDPVAVNAVKAWDTIRGLVVLGHANAPITHAGRLIFLPDAWGQFLPSVRLGFKLLAGDVWGANRLAAYQTMMREIAEHPQYPAWTRAGLATKVGVEDEIAQYLRSGFLGRIGIRGNMAMGVLKWLRIQRMEVEMKKLSPELRADSEVVQRMAGLVNNETGILTANTKLSAAARALQPGLFAGQLEGSRWKNVILNPIEAARLYAKGDSATNAEKVFRSYVVRQNARLAASYLTALGANAFIVSAFGNGDEKDKINFLDPTKADWLAFKWSGQTVIAPSNFLAPLRLALATVSAPFIKGARNDLGDRLKSYTLGKLHPGFTDIKELVEGKEAYTDRPLPWARGKDSSKKPALAWWEYLVSKAPIPIAQAVQDTTQALIDEGVHPDMARIITAASIGASSGLLGVHAHETTAPPKKPHQVPWDIFE